MQWEIEDETREKADEMVGKAENMNEEMKQSKMDGISKESKKMRDSRGEHGKCEGLHRKNCSRSEGYIDL